MKQQENRAEPQEKQIRFIDSHYNLKFYIPDGGKIKITFRDGHTADRVCKYIDDYRFPHLQENRHRMSARVLSRAIVPFCLREQSSYLLVLFSPYLLHRRQW